MQRQPQSVNPLRVIAKALLLFAIFNAAFSYFAPSIAPFSVYGKVLPAVARFPVYFRTYNPSAPHQIGIGNVYDLDILFSSHLLSHAKKGKKEYRIVVVGDSTVRNSGAWDELNRQHLKSCDGRTVRFYNIGYPSPSLLKDLMLLQESMKYKPDMILWSFAQDAFRQDAAGFRDANRIHYYDLEMEYGLPRNVARPSLMESLIARTIVDRREQLHVQTLLDIDATILARAFGRNNAKVMSTATAEAAPPPPVNPHQFSTSANFSKYLFQALDVAQQIAGNTPIIYISEPVTQGTEQNGYDLKQYGVFSTALRGVVAQHDWMFLDLWNMLGPQEFVDGLHRNAQGDTHLEQRLTPVILKASCAGQNP